MNNAGVAYRDAMFGATEALDTVNVNTFGTMRVTRALLPLLAPASAVGAGGENTSSPNNRRQNKGRIVNVASIESDLKHSLSKPLQNRFVDPFLIDKGIEDLMLEFVEAVRSGNQRQMGWGGTMYHASKVGQMAFASVIGRELSIPKRANVTIVSCCPGFVKTDMSSFCYGPGMGHKSPAEGADTPVWLALMQGQEATRSSGRFFTERREVVWQ